MSGTILPVNRKDDCAGLTGLPVALVSRQRRHAPLQTEAVKKPLVTQVKLKLHQSLANRVANQAGGLVNIELLHNAAAVRFGGAHA